MHRHWRKVTEKSDSRRMRCNAMATIGQSTLAFRAMAFSIGMHMRIIHTADWHLCDRLGHVNRTEDLKTRVAIVADLCERHCADVLLIAGDLFSERVSREDVTSSLTDLRLTFKRFFARGGTVLAVTGN